MNYEKVDINLWKRKEQYLFFKNYNNPYVGVTSPINCDNIVKIVKNKDVSFYGLMIYLCLKTINEIDEFKYVLEEGNIFKYEDINASFSIIDVENNLNYSRIVKYNKFDEFINDFNCAKIEAENHIKYTLTTGNNKCYFTCFPWIRITSLNNPIDSVDSIPRICWGKYYSIDGCFFIDLSLQVNHAFIDGYHIGEFYNILQKNIDEFTIEGSSL